MLRDWEESAYVCDGLNVISVAEAAWRGYPGAALENAADAGEERHGATGGVVVADVHGNCNHQADIPVLLSGGGSGILD